MKRPQDQTSEEWLAAYDNAPDLGLTEKEIDMAKVKESGGGNFKQVPAGSYAAICNMVAHVGLQKSSYLGKEKLKRQVYVRFQIPSERIEWMTKEGQKQEGPMVIGKTYTESLSEKANLRKELEGWRGRVFTPDELKGFELFDVLGKPVMLSIIHDTWEDGSIHAMIASLSKMPKGMPAPTLEGDLLKYDHEATGDLTKLPEWLQKKIASQITEQEAPATAPADAGSAFEPDSDIPF